jgi:hypothetical protein
MVPEPAECSTGVVGGQAQRRMRADVFMDAINALEQGSLSNSLATGLSQWNGD